MYDELMHFHLFEFNSGFSGSVDVDEIVMDSSGMDTGIEGSEFTQQFARMLLTSFLGVCFFYCLMLIL